MKDQVQICEKFKQNMQNLKEVIKWKTYEEMNQWKSLRHEKSKNSQGDQVTWIIVHVSAVLTEVEINDYYYYY